MSILRILFRLILVCLILFSCFFFLILINTPSIGSSASGMLMCEKHLKAISNAAKLYQDEWEGKWPTSLLELGQYYKGEYNPAPNEIPKCPGGGSLTGDTADSDYFYYQPIVNEVVPVCWDSKPHHTKLFLLPDTYLSNVLYSDGHIERLSEKELFRELFGLAKTNPNVLKVLNYPNKKISYIRLTLLLVGIVIGLILAQCYRFVTKK